VRRGGVRHALVVAILHGFKKILVIFLDGVSTDNDARVGHVGCVLSKERGDICRIVALNASSNFLALLASACFWSSCCWAKADNAKATMANNRGSFISHKPNQSEEYVHSARAEAREFLLSGFEWM
jgi:hypothetical protein